MINHDEILARFFKYSSYYKIDGPDGCHYDAQATVDAGRLICEIADLEREVQRLKDELAERHEVQS